MQPFVFLKADSWFFIKAKADQNLPGLVRTRSDLARIGALGLAPEMIFKHINGKRKLVLDHFTRLCDKLGIGLHEVRRIVDMDRSQPGEKYLKALEIAEKNCPPTDVALDGFLANLRWRGLARSIGFFPNYKREDSLEDLCIPVRVHPIDPWNPLMPEAGETFSSSSPGVFFNSWLMRANQRVVLRGEPGEGKTTAFWLAISHLARQAMESSDASIPLFLPLRQWQESTDLAESAIAWTLKVAGFADHSGLRSSLLARVREARTAIFLDGLDELTDPQPLKDQIVGLDKNVVVLSTRYHADPTLVMPQHVALRIVPLRPWTIERFMIGYFQGHSVGPSRLAAARRRLRNNPPLRQMVRNPLMLAVFTRLHAEVVLHDVPSTRAGLLRQAASAYFERGDKARGFSVSDVLRNSEKLEVLIPLAFQFHRELPLPIPESELVKHLERSRSSISRRVPKSGQAFLEELLQDGIICRDGTGPIFFTLRQIHEWCIAAYLAQMADAADFCERILSRYDTWVPGGPGFRALNHPGWSAIWPILAGECTDPMPFITALQEDFEKNEDILETRLRQLAVCLGQVSANPRFKLLQHQIVVCVLKAMAEQNMRPEDVTHWQEAAAQLDPQILFLQLTKDIPDAEPWMLLRMLKTLGFLGTAESINLLGTFLEKSEPILDATATALGMVGTPTARRMLVERLRIPSGGTRAQISCIQGLATIGDPESISIIKSFVLSTQLPAPAMLAAITGAAEAAGPEMEAVFLDIAARCASSISGKRSHGKWNTNDCKSVLLECLLQLGKFAGPITARALLPLLCLPQLESFRVFNTIAQTGDEFGREELRKRTAALKNRKPDWDTVASAISLFAIRDAASLPLLDITPNLSSDARTMVVVACRGNRSERVREFLFDTIEADPNMQVRELAAETLSDDCDATCIPGLLRILKTTKVSEIRFSCAVGLAKLGIEDGIECLAEILQKEVKNFLHLAVESVHHTTSEKLRKAVLNVYLSPSQDAQAKTIAHFALSQIQRQQGWRPLKDGRWDAP